jgi:hypothetical protein
MPYASTDLICCCLSFFIVLCNKVLNIWNSRDELVVIRGRSKTRSRGPGPAHKTQGNLCPKIVKIILKYRRIKPTTSHFAATHNRLS